MGILQESPTEAFSDVQESDGMLSLFSVLADEKNNEENVKEISCEEFLNNVKEKLYIFVKILIFLSFFIVFCIFYCIIII